jgi:hypothetical protein
MKDWYTDEILRTSFMYEKKLRVEKLELVKRLIRKNDYNQYEKTHSECIELGLNVRRPALDKLADKLALLDKQSPPKLDFEKSPEHLAKTEITFGDEYTERNKDFIQLEEDQVSQTASKTKTYESFEEMEQRQSEITFELGTLKIKEHELLTELSQLKHKNSH